MHRPCNRTFTNSQLFSSKEKQRQWSLALRGPGPHTVNRVGAGNARPWRKRPRRLPSFPSWSRASGPWEQTVEGALAPHGGFPLPSQKLWTGSCHTPLELCPLPAALLPCLLNPPSRDLINRRDRPYHGDPEPRPTLRNSGPKDQKVPRGASEVSEGHKKARCWWPLSGDAWYPTTPRRPVSALTASNTAGFLQTRRKETCFSLLVFMLRLQSIPFTIS